MGFDDGSTYITDRTASTSRRSRTHRGSNLGALATAGAAGAGLAALRNRSRSRSQRSRTTHRRHGGRPSVLSSHHDSHLSESFIQDEKHGDDRKKNTWRNRLLGAGAAAGGIMALKSVFIRKKPAKTEESLSDISYSRPPMGRSEVTQTDLSRLEEGRAPTSPGRDHWRRVEEREAAQAAAMGASPLRQGHRPTRSGGSLDSFDSRTSLSDLTDVRPQSKSQNVREGIATLGVIGFLRHRWQRRGRKEEDDHVASIRQQDLEEERLARANSSRRKFTGDGVPPRRANRPPSTFISESDISGVTPARSRANLAPPRSTTDLTPADPAVGPSTGPVPPPPSQHRVLSDSDSEVHGSAGGGRHRRQRPSGSGALAAGAAAAAHSGSPSRRDHSQRRGSKDGSVSSPPVSVKVKMHNDGRHVTLRRLNEEEAAAEREARKKNGQRKGRNGSMSSLSNFERQEHWRRTEAREAEQAQQMAHEAAPVAMPEPTIPPPPPGPPPNFSRSTENHTPLPPPPPIPAGGGSVLSSPHGTQAYGTETDVSAYDSNRRRRRAERAQAKARQGGSRVEFS
jgi:hypothetical protein